MGYAKGTVAHFHNEFRDPHTGALVDPPVVRFKYTPPGGATTTLVYGVDAALTKTAVGKYQATVDFSASGVWSLRWETTGAYQGATGDIKRTVEASVF